MLANSFFFFANPFPSLLRGSKGRAVLVVVAVVAVVVVVVVVVVAVVRSAGRIPDGGRPAGRRFACGG